MYKVEYLIITKQEGSFCDSTTTFIKLLEVDSSISIKDNTITYQNKTIPINATFKLKTGEISEKKERYFHLEVESISNDDLDNFSSFNTKIKEILLRISPNDTKVNTLWNDIGREYAIKAYPLLNETENLMRKLISQFMLINVGMDWSEQEIHEEIKDKIQRYEKQEPYVDDLYKTDFIHLSDVLFKKYRTVGVDQIHRLVSEAKKSEDLDINTLKKFIPQSNWEKHFSPMIEYDEKKLQDKWNILYTLRNNVAHNRFITKEDYYKIKGMVGELKKIITSAINKLDEIDLKHEEKEEVKFSYKPNSIALMEQMVGISIANWYIDNYANSRVTLSTVDFGYDLIVEHSDMRRIGVTIKYARAETLAISLKKTIEYVENSFGFDEYHIVVAIVDYSPDMFINFKKIESLTNIKKAKIFIGFLDENAIFKTFF